MVRVLIADEHEVVRRGVCATLSNNLEIEIAGEACNGREAVEKARELRPAVVIMGISMAELNGIDAARAITRECPDVRVLIFTMHASEQLLWEALDAGARGYVLKSDIGEELVHAVQAVHSGQMYFSPKLTNLLVVRYLDISRSSSRGTAPLSERESRVLTLLAQGRNNKEIGALLGIGANTVAAHRAHIMRKLHLKSFRALVRYAMRSNTSPGEV